MMTLPWRLPRATVALLDDARVRLGMHTRSALLARALVELFERTGEDTAAAALRADIAAIEQATRDGGAEERIRTTG
jgi:DNA-binding GntR family transcriptional regulator